MNTITTTCGGLKVTPICPKWGNWVLKMATDKSTYIVDRWYDYKTLSGCKYAFYNGNRNVLEWHFDVAGGEKIRPLLAYISELIVIE